MLQFKSILFLTSLIILLFLCGCKNDDGLSPDDVVPQKHLSRIVQDSSNYSLFLYGGNKLLKYECISYSRIIEGVNLHYDNKNRPQSEDYRFENNEYLKKYYYSENDQLEKMEFLTKDSTSNYAVFRYEKYFYNDLYFLSKTELYANNDQLLSYTEFIFNNSGNMVEVRFFGTDGLTQVTTMTYDNKINPWYNLKDWLLYEATLSKNNVITYSSLTISSDTENRREMKHTYTYDSYGYPLTEQTEYTSETHSGVINQKI